MDAELYYKAVDDAVTTYSNCHCPVYGCWEFLFWDGIYAHWFSHHAIPDNVVLGYN